MELKHFCVIDAQKFYKTLVLVLFSEDENGDRTEEIQSYTLHPGESLLDTAHPVVRPHAGASGFVKPMWDADASVWVEAATEEEIAAWEAEHPAPKKPEPAPTVEELQAKIAALTTSNQMLEDCLVEMAAVVYA